MKIFRNLLRIHTFIIQNWTVQREFRIRTCNQGVVLLLTEEVSFFRMGVRLAFSTRSKMGLWTREARPLPPQEGESVRYGGHPGRTEFCFFSCKTEIYFLEHFWAHRLLFFICSPLTSSFLFPSQLTIRKEFLWCPVFWKQLHVPVLKCWFLQVTMNCGCWLLSGLTLWLTCRRWALQPKVLFHSQKTLWLIP